MTTNHIEKLDAALIRPGRVDMLVPFQLADTSIIETIFRGMFATLEGDLPPVNKLTSSTEVLNGKAFVASTEHKSAETDTDKDEHARIAKLELLAKEFAMKVPTGLCSPAEVQGFLLGFKRDAEKALESVDAWVEDIMKRKSVEDTGKSLDDTRKSLGESDGVHDDVLDTIHKVNGVDKGTLA